MAQELDHNTRLVIQHFDDFVNKRDLGAIDRNVAVAHRGRQDRRALGYRDPDADADRRNL